MASFFSDTAHHLAALTPHLNSYLGVTVAAQTKFNYAVKPSITRTLLESRGANFPDHAISPHIAHPHSKTLQILNYQALLRMFPDGLPTFSTKASKHSLIPIRNPIFTIGDIGRFSEMQVEGPFFEARIMALDDVIQHMSITEMANFADTFPNTETFMCTATIPPESLYLGSSDFPDLYTVTYTDSEMICSPDGHLSASYAQPLSASKWLVPGRIATKAWEYSYSPISSNFDHHIIAFTRRPVKLTTVSYDHGDSMFLPRFMMPFSTTAQRKTSAVAVRKLVDYVNRNKNLTKFDVYAKMSQFLMIEATTLQPTQSHAAVRAAIQIGNLRISSNGWVQAFYELICLLTFGTAFASYYQRFAMEKLWAAKHPLSCIEPTVEPYDDSADKTVYYQPVKPQTLHIWTPNPKDTLGTAINRLMFLASLALLPKIILGHLLQHVFDLPLRAIYYTFISWTRIDWRLAGATLLGAYLMSWFGLLGNSNLMKSAEVTARTIWYQAKTRFDYRPYAETIFRLRPGNNTALHTGYMMLLMTSGFLPGMLNIDVTDHLHTRQPGPVMLRNLAWILPLQMLVATEFLSSTPSADWIASWKDLFLASGTELVGYFANSVRKQRLWLSFIWQQLIAAHELWQSQRTGRIRLPDEESSPAETAQDEDGDSDDDHDDLIWEGPPPSDYGSSSDGESDGEDEDPLPPPGNLEVNADPRSDRPPLAEPETVEADPLEPIRQDEEFVWADEDPEYPPPAPEPEPMLQQVILPINFANQFTGTIDQDAPIAPTTDGSYGNNVYWDTHKEAGFQETTLRDYIRDHGAKTYHVPDLGMNRCLRHCLGLERNEPPPDVMDRLWVPIQEHLQVLNNQTEGSERRMLQMTHFMKKQLLEPTFNLTGPAGAAKSTIIRSLLREMSGVNVLIIAPANSLLEDYRPLREICPEINIHYGSQHTRPCLDINGEFTKYDLTIIDEVYMMPEAVAFMFMAACQVCVTMGDSKQGGPVQIASATGKVGEFHPYTSPIIDLTVSFSVPLDVMTYLKSSNKYPREYQTASQVQHSLYYTNTNAYRETPAGYQGIRFSEAQAQFINDANLETVITSQGHRYKKTFCHFSSGSQGLASNLPRGLLTMMTRHSETMVVNGASDVMLEFFPAVDWNATSANLSYPTDPAPENMCVINVISEASGLSTATVIATIQRSTIPIRHREGKIHGGDIGIINELFEISIQPWDRLNAFMCNRNSPTIVVNMHNGHMSLGSGLPTNIDDYFGSYIWETDRRIQAVCERQASELDRIPNIVDIGAPFQCRDERDGEFMDFRPDKDLAMDGLHDLESLKFPNDAYYKIGELKGMVRNAEVRIVQLRVLMGLPGSGKSTAAIREKLQNYSSTYMAVPSENLRVQTRKATKAGSFQGDGYLFPTFPALISQNPSGHVIIDEASKLYKGALDAILLAHQRINCVTLIMDPAQGLATRITTQSATLECPEAYERFAPYMSGYRSTTHRLAIGVSETLGLRTTSQRQGHFIAVRAAPVRIPLIVASPRYGSVLMSMGNDAIAIEDVEGLTFEGDYAIDFNSLTKDVDNHTALVLLTRGKGNVYLVISGNQMTTCRSSILAAVINSLVSTRRGTRHPRVWVHHHLAKVLPNTIVLQSNLDALLNNPYFGSWNEHLREQQCRAPDSLVRTKKKYAMHYPTSITSRDAIYRTFLEDRPSKESRERYDEFGNRTCQVSEFHTDADIAPRHSARDKATENISYSVRMKTSTPERNGEQYTAGHEQGKMLFNAFLKATKLPKATFTTDLHEYYQEEAFDTWASGRTASDFKRAANSSHPDRSALLTETFLKGGVIRKLGALNAPAKTGQIVTTFPLTEILYEAPFAKFVEAHVLKHCPRNIYLHCGKTLEDTKAWYEENWRSSDTTATDYTAWDTGCDGAFLQFDRLLMEHCGLPYSFVDHYVYRKLNTRMFKGVLTIMQLSGDRWTWLLNTLRNLALSHLRFLIPSNCPQAFSGDDMILAGRIPINPKFVPKRWKHQMKLMRGEREAFCGMVFGGRELTIDAAQLLARVKIAAANPRTPVGTFVNYEVLAAGYVGSTEAQNGYYTECLRILASKLPNSPSREAYEARHYQ